MLKNLLETLIESIFTFRKGWIAEQSLPVVSGSFQTKASQSGSTVSPVNGWARVQAQCNSLQAASGGGDCLVTVDNQNNNWPSIILPVKKGATLVYSVLNGFNGEVSIWFIPNQASQ